MTALSDPDLLSSFFPWFTQMQPAGEDQMLALSFNRAMASAKPGVKVTHLCSLCLVLVLQEKLPGSFPDPRVMRLLDRDLEREDFSPCAVQYSLGLFTNLPSVPFSYVVAVSILKAKN